MKKRSVINESVLTKEQIEHRKSVLKSRYKPKKEKQIPVPPPEKTTRVQYMRNCMFWIEEFETGRTTKERFIEVIIALQNHCIAILKENLPQKTQK